MQHFLLRSKYSHKNTAFHEGLKLPSRKKGNVRVVARDTKFYDFYDDVMASPSAKSPDVKGSTR